MRRGAERLEMRVGAGVLIVAFPFCRSAVVRGVGAKGAAGRCCSEAAAHQQVVAVGGS